MNLLIIEDDAICTFINNRVAQTSGIFNHVHSVKNGKEALDYFQDIAAGYGNIPAPDIILLDLNMPVLNGFDFITALRQLSFPNKENISIIILTSSNDSLDHQRARALGVDKYLLKPLSVNELQTTIFSLDKKVWKKSLKCA